MALLRKEHRNDTLLHNELINFGNNLSIIQKRNGNKIVATPMYVHSFRFITPKKVSEAQRLMQKFSISDANISVADKLRYYRHKKGLYQNDVADYLGIDRSTYCSYEANQMDYYSAVIMDKIAELFEVDVYALLDDYNKFLYDGQGENIKKLRKQLKITQEELAKEMNVSLLKIERWEQDKVRMFKFTWEKLMLIATENKQNIS